MDYIVPIFIFVSTTIVICILFDIVLLMRMKRRMRDTAIFIESMKDFDVDTRIPFT